MNAATITTGARMYELWDVAQAFGVGILFGACLMYFAMRLVLD